MTYRKKFEDAYLDEEGLEIDELVKSAEVSFSEGQNEESIAKWAKIAELAEKAGNKELYYRATERMANIG